MYNWSALLFLNLYFNVFCFFHLSLTTHTSRLASNYVHLCSAALPFVPCALAHIGWQSISFYFIPFVLPYIDVPCGIPFGTQSHRLVSCKNAKMTLTRQISETRWIYFPCLFFSRSRFFWHGAFLHTFSVERMDDVRIQLIRHANALDNGGHFVNWQTWNAVNAKSTAMKCCVGNNGDEHGDRCGIGHSFQNYAMVQRLN